MNMYYVNQNGIIICLEGSINTLLLDANAKECF